MLSTPLEKLVVAVGFLTIIGLLVATYYSGLAGQESEAMAPSDVAYGIAGKLLFSERNSSVVLGNVVLKDTDMVVSSYEDTVFSLVGVDVSIPGLLPNITIYKTTYVLRTLGLSDNNPPPLPEQPSGLAVVVYGGVTSNISYIEVIRSGDMVILVPKLILFYNNVTLDNGVTEHRVSIFITSFKKIVYGGGEYDRRRLDGRYNIIITQSIIPVTPVPVERLWFGGESDVYVSIKNTQYSGEQYAFHVAGDDKIILSIYKVLVTVSIELVG